MSFTPEFLGKVVDTLLPGLPATEDAAALPAASTLGIGRQLAEHLRIHHDRDQLVASLQAIANQAGGLINFVKATETEATAVVQTIEATESAAFQALLFIVAADYYENEEVIRNFGWRVTPPQPLGYPLPPFNEALLESVKHRPALWRSDKTAK